MPPGARGDAPARGKRQASWRVLIGLPVEVAHLVHHQQVLGWAGSSLYQPTLRVEHDSRYLWVYGGDDRSHFRRLLRYAHGRVTLGQTERNMKNPRSVKGPKREKH